MPMSAAVGVGLAAPGCQALKPSANRPSQADDAEVVVVDAYSKKIDSQVKQASAIQTAMDVSKVKLLAPRDSDAVAPETIDLGAALRLAGIDNPTINLARERTQEALAGQLAARTLLLPSINAGGMGGATIVRHDMGDGDTLTETEASICKTMGVDPKKFKAHQKKQKAGS